MIIREFSERDIDEITSLMSDLCKLKGHEFDEDRWRSSIEERLKKDSNSEIIVAFEEETSVVLGMAYCSVRYSEQGFRFGYISNLIVKEEKRRTGIGEEILRHIIDYFKRNRINSIRMTLKPNIETAAKILFAKLGFQEILQIYELRV
ncbi:MAG: GNAT family N-acetyltransferase [Candidatus Hodarchaeota archaeon]